jgi:signal transduction histidine kinase
VIGASPAIVIVTTVALAFSTILLVLVLWYDPIRTATRDYAVFLFFNIVWQVGSVSVSLGESLGMNSDMLLIPEFMLATGSVGASLAFLVASSSRFSFFAARMRQVAALVFGAWLLVLLGLSLLSGQGMGAIIVTEPGGISGSGQIVIVGTNLISAWLVWRFRRKSRDTAFYMGSFLFLAGQLLMFAGADTLVTSYATSIAAIAVMVLAFSVVRREIIAPLRLRDAQVAAMHDISLAITRETSSSMVLNEIVSKATGLLDADAACLFLLQADGSLVIAAAHELPQRALDIRLGPGEGVAGTAIARRETIFIDHYHRDWHGVPDLPGAKATFGSTICAPLTFGDHVLGAILVVSGLHRQQMERKEAYLLELMAAQAAVAIGYSQLLDGQLELSKQLRTAVDQLDAVLRSTDSPVVALDRNLRVIFVNDAAAALTGQTKQIIGRAIMQEVPLAWLPASFLSVERQIRKNGVYTYELLANGRYYAGSVAPYGKTAREGWVAVFADITEFKEVDRLKSEMIRMTSHDLKNPLQAALSNLELLQEDVRELNNREVDLSIDAIGNELHKMHQMITAILDIERATLEIDAIQSCDLFEIVSSAAEELRRFANEHQCSIVIAPEARQEVFALGNCTLLRRAFVNLIENAVKFSPNGGTIEIRLAVVGNTVQLRIIDQGIGIPEAILDRVFDRFFRGQQQGVQHVGGTGLGLSLVKSVVMQHKGTISVESAVGRGTTFLVTLPVYREYLVG